MFSYSTNDLFANKVPGKNRCWNLEKKNDKADEIQIRNFFSLDLLVLLSETAAITLVTNFSRSPKFRKILTTVKRL